MNPFPNQIKDIFPDTASISEARNSALEKLSKTEFPKPEQEVWKYSKIFDLDLKSLAPSLESPDGSKTKASFLDIAESDLVEITDGWLTSGKGNHSSGDSGVYVGSLANTDADLTNFEKHLIEPKDFFGCLNRSYNPETLLIHIPNGVTLESPIYIKVQSATSGSVACPRVIVSLGENSAATIIEHHSSGSGESLSVPVLDAYVGQNARLKHCVLQDLGKKTWQVSKQNFQLEKDAYLEVFTGAFGGDYARSEIRCELKGRGSEAYLSAAYFGNEEQTLDFRTFQKHEAPNTTSKLLFKGALDGDSRSIYSGLIKVLPEAVRTKAQQTNRNIKLSENAWAESVPNLEIETNDVVCTHASTVAGIDEEQLFYLESKGIETSLAERLIIAGFFDDVISQAGDSLLVGEATSILTEILGNRFMGQGE
ncbi:MAG TPA: Fe-S cluster assembly protein SufD [Acidimicrobiales bacterium]|nr:Fe-S cluster assembly protein SufD [Acidimicrobiales bacterium]